MLTITMHTYTELKSTCNINNFFFLSILVKLFNN
jgi:hypothetical protein